MRSYPIKGILHGITLKPDQVQIRNLQFYGNRAPFISPKVFYGHTLIALIIVQSTGKIDGDYELELVEFFLNVALHNSMFHQVFFPEINSVVEQSDFDSFRLSRLVRCEIPKELQIDDVSLVVFDFETTGLDPHNDRIIEFGGVKLKNWKIESEFSTLVNPERSLTGISKKISGITDDMLLDQPKISEVLPDFMKFIEGSALVAHNAEFDMSFLKANASRQGMILQWPCFCTLKLTRSYLPQLESRSLDALARYFNLNFESRHRSIGDIKVTIEVMKNVIQTNRTNLSHWRSFAPYLVNE